MIRTANTRLFRIRDQVQDHYDGSGQELLDRIMAQPHQMELLGVLKKKAKPKAEEATDTAEGEGAQSVESQESEENLLPCDQHLKLVVVRGQGPCELHPELVSSVSAKGHEQEVQRPRRYGFDLREGGNDTDVANSSASGVVGA